MNNIIVTTWGIGPSYRKRVVHNINKAIDTGYDNILPYVILTDKPDDFYELQDKTKKVFDILNVHEIREKLAPWSSNYEYIPKEQDPAKYSIDYRNSAHLQKNFSYALHRFSLPRISELGYNRFIYCDCDTDILYDKIVKREVSEKEFWNEYDTPVNTMKGCDLQTWQLSSDDWWANNNIILGNILRFALCQKYPEYQKPYAFGMEQFYLKRYHTQTEGPFRYYHLKDSGMTSTYFELWNEATRIAQTNRELQIQLTTGGGYITIDNTPVTAVNDVLGIKPMHFTTKWHKVNIYLHDRHFFPRGYCHTVNGKVLSLQPTDTLEEFYEKNKELIDYLKSINSWCE